jgi:hypothetical protein
MTSRSTRRSLRYEQYRHAAASELRDSAHQVFLGGNVDAARGLIEYQQPRPRGQPARQQHPLLVAAGQLADGGLAVRRRDAQCRDQPRRELPLFGDRHAPRQPWRACSASTMFSRTESSPRSLGLALFRAEGEPVADGLRRAAQCHDGAVDGYAAVAAIESEGQAREFGTARAQQSGDSDDLARGDAQVHRMDAAPARHLSQLQQWRRSGGGGTQGRERPLSRREFVPHHRGDQPAAVQFRSDVLSDAPAIAQHRHAVRDHINLVEEVRDEQDAMPCRAGAA